MLSIWQFGSYLFLITKKSTNYKRHINNKLDYEVEQYKFLAKVLKLKFVKLFCKFVVKLRIFLYFKEILINKMHVFRRDRAMPIYKTHVYLDRAMPYLYTLKTKTHILIFYQILPFLF